MPASPNEDKEKEDGMKSHIITADWPRRASAMERSLQASEKTENSAHKDRFDI